MAETASTAAGIAGILGVLQSPLKGYQDFLTARDFGDDLAICQIRAALLESSTVTWAIAVRLQHDSGEPRKEFLIDRPTVAKMSLVEATLDLIRKQLQTANSELDAYIIDEVATGESDEEDNAVGAGGESSNLRRQHDVEHPGTLKRTTWALVDKSRLKSTLDKVPILVDRLNTDFAPIDQKSQLAKYCEAVKALGLSVEELKEVGAAAGDHLFKTVVKLLETEHIRGGRFIGMKVSADGIVNIGDHYDKDWKGGAQRQTSRKDTFEQFSVTDRAFVNIGDSFGGKSPLQMRIEQMEAARRVDGAGPDSG